MNLEGRTRPGYSAERDDDSPRSGEGVSFKGSGGSYAKLFDGTEKMLSWDNILWINRSVLLP